MVFFIVFSICDLTRNDINNIMNGESNVTRFLDDEYLQDDIFEAFEDFQKMFSNILNEEEKIAKQYKYLKTNCKITDMEIAKLFKMSRSTMNLKLKKVGLK